MSLIDIPGALQPLLRKLADEAEAVNVKLYVVGGFVRDLLLGKPNLDIDLVVEGDAITFAQSLVSRYGGKCEVHTAFRTATWKLNTEIGTALRATLPDSLDFIDFATARTETYPEPAVLPVVTPSTIERDLFRRDFTINTLALCLAPLPFGELVDPYHGLEDLLQGRIRVLHDQSFIDDPTRIFRAVRFERRLNFSITPDTLRLLRDALPYIERLTGERVRHEIDLLLAEERPEDALRRLKSLGALQMLDSRFEFDEWSASALAAARGLMNNPHWHGNRPESKIDTVTVYWTILLCRVEDAESLIERLSLSRAVSDPLQEVQNAYHSIVPYLSEQRQPSEIHHVLEGLSNEALVAAWAIAANSEARRQITLYARDLRHVRLVINGNDLKAQGLRPGPHFGRLLARLRDAKIDGLINTPQQEWDYLEGLIAEWRRTNDGD